MTHKSRLDKLEKAAAEYVEFLPQAAEYIATILLEAMAPPTGVPQEIWLRAVRLLADYTHGLLYPWKDLEQLFNSCRGKHINELEDLPDPLLDAVGRAAVEAETGKLPEDWLTRNLHRLSRLAKTPDGELIEYLRRLEEGDEDYCLPRPYSRFLLKQFPDEDFGSRCMTQADRLRRGEITATEHAAELATFLPPVTRADLEQAVWNRVEMSVACEDKAESLAQARDALAAYNATQMRKANAEPGATLRRKRRLDLERTLPMVPATVLIQGGS